MKERETIPDLVNRLREIYSVARELDEQVARIEYAYGRERPTAPEPDEKAADPAPLVELEDNSKRILVFLQETRTCLQKELDLLLGERLNP